MALSHSGKQFKKKIRLLVSKRIHWFSADGRPIRVVGSLIHVDGRLIHVDVRLIRVDGGLIRVDMALVTNDSAVIILFNLKLFSSCCLL